MIKEELNAKHLSPWDDLGFSMKGDTSRILWVNKAMARDAFEMDLDVDAAGVVQIDSLKRELAKRRKHILGLLDDE